MDRHEACSSAGKRTERTRVLLPSARRTKNENTHLQHCRKNKDARKTSKDQTARDCRNMMACSGERHQAQILHEKKDGCYPQRSELQTP